MAEGLKISIPTKTKELQDFIYEFNRDTEFNPVEKDNRLWEDKVKIGVNVFNGSIQLNYIATISDRGKGYASEALKWLCQLADKHKVSINLSAVPLGSLQLNGKPRLSKKQLEQWYKKYGFKDTKNGDLMRKPESWPNE